MRKENMKFDPKILRKIVNKYLTIKCITFRTMFCFKFNDYYAENHGLK